MFTGIIQELGQIEAIERGEQSARFTVRAGHILDAVKIGDSKNFREGFIEST